MSTLAKVNSLIAWLKAGDVTGPCPSISVEDWEAIARALSAQEAAAVQAAPVIAYATVNEEGDPAMLFFDKQEAMGYCEDDDEPIPLADARGVQAVGADGVQDARRLDWLEERINADGEIHLHDGAHPYGTGLGLRPGWVVRTLRAAIDAALPPSGAGEKTS